MLHPDTHISTILVYGLPMNSSNTEFIVTYFPYGGIVISCMIEYNLYYYYNNYYCLFIKNNDTSLRVCGKRNKREEIENGI